MSGADPFALPEGVTLDDPHARFASGMETGEAVRRAAQWWNTIGRRVIAWPEFQNQDTGLKSGITRGLPFDQLTAAEATRVVVAWHAKWEREERGDDTGANGVRAPEKRLFRP